MANIKIEIHDRNIASRKESLMEWEIPEVEKKALLKFLDELELGKVNKGIKISESRQSKYLDVLKAPLVFFYKPVTQLTMKDIEKFEKALSSGTLKSLKGEPYSQATRVDMRRALKIYLKWRLGEVKGNNLTDWLDTRDVFRTPDYLNEAQILKLYKACKSNAERYLVAVLFDAGARATEFHNIRAEDVQMPKDKDNFVKVTLKEEYSKTKGRTISLYWTYSLEAVRDFIKEREIEGMKSADQVYTNSYASARKFLQRLGKKILDKSIHYHLFRHSSATFYATRLNRQQLCYRYGWKFSSDMPDIYISRTGMEGKEIDEKFTATELESMQKKLQADAQKYAMELELLKKDIEKEKTENQDLRKSMSKTAKLRNDVLVEIDRVEKDMKERDEKSYERALKDVLEQIKKDKKFLKELAEAAKTS